MRMIYLAKEKPLKRETHCETLVGMHSAKYYRVHISMNLKFRVSLKFN